MYDRGCGYGKIKINSSDGRGGDAALMEWEMFLAGPDNAFWLFKSIW